MRKAPPVPNKYINNIEAFRKAKKIWFVEDVGPRRCYLGEGHLHEKWFEPGPWALFENYWDAWAYHLKLKQWEKENER